MLKQVPMYSVVYLNMLQMGMLKTHTGDMNIDKVEDSYIEVNPGIIFLEKKH